MINFPLIKSTKAWMAPLLLPQVANHLEDVETGPRGQTLGKHEKGTWVGGLI